VCRTCALSKAGTLSCWGRSPAAFFPEESDTLPRPLLGNLTVTDFAVAQGELGMAVCAVDTGGATYCLGYYAGWEDYRPYGPSPSPTLLEDTIPLSELSVGDGHAGGIAPDGTAV
jgi:hypothetical protein